MLRELLGAFWKAQDHTQSGRGGRFMDGYKSMIVVNSVAHHALALESRDAFQNDTRAALGEAGSLSHVDVLLRTEEDRRTRYFPSAAGPTGQTHQGWFRSEEGRLSRKLGLGAGLAGVEKAQGRTETGFAKHILRCRAGKGQAVVPTPCLDAWVVKANKAGRLKNKAARFSQRLAFVAVVCILPVLMCLLLTYFPAGTPFSAPSSEAHAWAHGGARAAARDSARS